MRVLMINSVCGIKSTGRICTDLATLLEENGSECRIGYGRDTVPERYNKYAIRIGSDFDVKTHGIKARLLDDSGFGSKKATQDFISKVEEFDPDVIHLHNLHGYYVNIEVLFNYIKRSEKKVIWTLHDGWPFTGHCACFSTCNCTRWKVQCYDCPKMREYPSSLLFDRSASNYARKKELFTSVSNLTLVTPSEWLANLTRESFLKEYPVTVIPNGIDTDVFKYLDSTAVRQKFGLLGKKIILGVASSWSAMKGYDDFIRLAQMLDDSWKVVLVGLDEKQMQTLPQGLVGIRRTNNTTELAQLYSAANVFFNPTYDDNYPTVNLEARACGAQVVTYRTGGSSESAGPNAIVVEQGDLNGAFKAIISAGEHKEEDIDSLSYKNRLGKYLDLYKA